MLAGWRQPRNRAPFALGPVGRARYPSGGQPGGTPDGSAATWRSTASASTASICPLQFASPTSARHAGIPLTCRSICSASAASIPPDASHPTCTLTWITRGAPVAYIDSTITCASLSPWLSPAPSTLTPHVALLAPSSAPSDTPSDRDTFSHRAVLVALHTSRPLPAFETVTCASPPGGKVGSPMTS